MASLSASSVSSAALRSTFSFSPSESCRITGFSFTSRSFPTRRLQISCQVAKPETVEKVIEIVAKQLASEEGTVQPHSKFQDLGADSLDQVEIVMALEEQFGINVDESGAESIVTVQDAANLIEKARAEKA